MQRASLPLAGSPQDNVHPDKAGWPGSPGEDGGGAASVRPKLPHRVPGEPPAASSIRTAVGAAARNLISPLMNCSASSTWGHCQSLGDRKPGLLTAAPGANKPAARNRSEIPPQPEGVGGRVQTLPWKRAPPTGPPTQAHCSPARPPYTASKCSVNASDLTGPNPGSPRPWEGPAPALAFEASLELN